MEYLFALSTAPRQSCQSKGRKHTPRIPGRNNVDTGREKARLQHTKNESNTKKSFPSWTEARTDGQTSPQENAQWKEPAGTDFACNDNHEGLKDDISDEEGHIDQTGSVTTWQSYVSNWLTCIHSLPRCRALLSYLQQLDHSCCCDR